MTEYSPTLLIRPHWKPAPIRISDLAGYASYAQTQQIQAREGLCLHHVFFLERVMVALEWAHSCSTFGLFSGPPSLSQERILWTLVITYSLGPMKLVCYIRVAKTIKYKVILSFGTKKRTLLNQDFVISVFFIMRVHCTWCNRKPSFTMETFKEYSKLSWVYNVTSNCYCICITLVFRGLYEMDTQSEIKQRSNCIHNNLNIKQVSLDADPICCAIKLMAQPLRKWKICNFMSFNVVNVTLCLYVWISLQSDGSTLKTEQNTLTRQSSNLRKEVHSEKPLSNIIHH